MRNHREVKQIISIALGILLATFMARAEPRTFTNAEGRKVEGELMMVENETAVLKLANGKLAKVPMGSLSPEDKTYVNTWWEENKNKIGPMDVRLTIDKKADRIERQVTRPKPAAGGKPAANQVTKKLTIDDFHYVCALKNYSPKIINGLTLDYIIYKRVIGRDKVSLKNTIEEITGTKEIRHLEAFGSEAFETEKVRCTDTSESGGGGGKGGGKSQMTWKRETILGIVITVSAGGKEIYKQSDPENFLDRLHEAEEREDSRE